MTPPLTGFEVHGDWTTLAEETAFLQQVDADTAATLSTIGQSTNGLPVHRVDLGTGVRNTMLVVSLVHGNEQASREGVLMQLRDLAYSTDPATLAYLANHRIVYITNASPDQFPTNRFNGNNKDPNRDFFKLDQIETRNIVAAILAVKPNLIVDAHEYFGTGSDWMGSAEPLPFIAPAIKDIQVACYTEASGEVKAQGYTSTPYSPEHYPRASLSGIAGAFHAVGILSETNALSGDPSVRVPVQRIVLDALMHWHGQNADACAEAARKSRQWASTTGLPYPLARMEHLNREDPPLVYAAGYQLLEQLPQRFVDLFGIRVEGNFVPLAQPARGMIPQVMDPGSLDKKVNAVPVPRSAPTTPLVGMKVHPPGSGAARQVTRARINSDGQLKTIRLPGNVQ